MPNIASALKNEISRVARKEARAETAALKKSATAHRKEIATLKRRTQALEQLVRRVARGKTEVQKAPISEIPEGQRFSAKGLASQRKRLGLSAAEVGTLLGTSAQSIYNWEQGKSRPRAGHLPAIAALRTLGKKTATDVVADRKAAT
jgi:DNA-binding transcriptional regulator YiaG